MTTATRYKYDAYVEDYEALLARDGSAPQWLRQIRQEAMESFRRLGMPTARRGNEKWKYTNVGPIASTLFRYAEEPGPVEARRLAEAAPLFDGWPTIVFVDGHFAPDLSRLPAPGHGEATVTTLARALPTHGEVVRRHLARQAQSAEDGFTALNTAFLHDGAFVHLPAGYRAETPIHVVFASSGRPGRVAYPRLLVVAEEDSQAVLVETYVGLKDERYFTDAVTEMALGKGASLDHYRLLLEAAKAYHVGLQRSRQSEGSALRSRTFQQGCAIGRYDLYALLDAPETECHLHGLYLTRGTDHLDNYVNIDHAKPYGTSRLYYKGILDGRSRAVFGGTVWVRRGAIKTDAQQEDKNLILSPHAEADSKPALYIWADDVKCGHGAAAGNIDANTVFYMRSRGLDLEEASRLLIYGFAREIIDTVEVEELRSYLEDLFLSSLPRHTFQF